jgi:hypothetical protein
MIFLTTAIGHKPVAYLLLTYFISAGTFVMAATPIGQQTSAPPVLAAQNAAPRPIPLPEIVAEAESASSQIRDIEDDVSSDRTTESVTQQLPALNREIDAHLGETRSIIAQRPSLETLGNLDGEWRRIRPELSSLNSDLIARLKELERETGQLEELGKIWNQTFNAAKNESAPSEVLRRIEAVVSAITNALTAIDKERARVLTLQARVGAQDARITDALAWITRKRENALTQVFLQDSAPIWSPRLRSQVTQQLQAESVVSFSTQWAELRAYVERQGPRFIIAAAVFIGFAAGLFWSRRCLRDRLMEHGGISTTAPVFETPLAAALMLTFFSSRWIFPAAPRLLWAILGAFALIPSVIILQRLIRLHLYPILYALIVFYFIDQIRSVVAAVRLLPRLLFAGEMLGAALFLLWLAHCLNRATLDPR